MKRSIIAGALAIALAGPAWAQTQQTDLVVSNAWSRATPSATSNGVVYFTVTDKGDPDSLTSASTPVAAEARLHESRTVNGVMQMRPVDHLDIDRDHPITLAPGGYHMMLTGMKQQLKAGDTFPLTLNFAHAGAVSTTVKVGATGAKGADMPGMKMDGMDMGGMNR
jgi:copper(I)-binding protein